MKNNPECSRDVALVLLMLAALLIGFGILPTVGAGTGTVGGQVYGFTCHDNIIPLAGATVTAVLIETGLTYPPTSTNPDGSYNLTLLPGDYMLYIAAHFFENQTSYAVAITSGSVMSGLNFYLYPVNQPYCPTVMFQDNLYTLAIYSNASATNLIFDSDRGLLNFTITGTNETTGRFLIATPRVLLDGTPVVFVDNVEVKSTFVEGATYYFVQFDNSLGSHTVTMGGTKTIPEFPSGYQLILVALYLALLGSLLTKRDRKVTNSR
jgi:hypothetical protein